MSPAQTVITTAPSALRTPPRLQPGSCRNTPRSSNALLREISRLPPFLAFALATAPPLGRARSTSSHQVTTSGSDSFSALPRTSFTSPFTRPPTPSPLPSPPHYP